MNLNNALKSTHNLKKCSYRMLRKLHGLEYRGSLKTFLKVNDEYYLIHCLQHMVDVIKEAYSNSNIDGADMVVSDLVASICLLKDTTSNKMRVDRTVLVSCLKSHTKTFNWLERNKVKIRVGEELKQQWSIRCVVAYIAHFGNRI